jgi:hypothetical protein
MVVARNYKMEGAVFFEFALCPFRKAKKTAFRVSEFPW